MQRSTTNIKAILQECKSRKKHMCITWRDYQKAFDSVPHSWIITSLELIGINDKIISFLKKAMIYWKTSMRQHAEGKILETEDLEILRGIYQGDSLSALLFRISLIPFTEQLNKLNTGYEEHTTKTKVSHLLYMDDLKLIGETEKELQKRMQVVRTFSNGIQWNLDLTSVQRLYSKEN